MRKVYIGYDLGDGEAIVSYQVWTDNYKDQTTKVDSFIMPTMEKNDIPIPTAYCKIGDNIFLGKDITEVRMTDDGYFAGNFKKRPSDLLQNYSEQDLADLFRVFTQETTDWPDVQLPEALIKLRDDVVTFTDALFKYKEIDEDGNEHCFMDELEPYFKIGDKIDAFIFCVGHPTKWGLEQEKGALDVAIYKKIMEQTCLGKGSFDYKGKVYPSELVLDAESRAAFLYTREYYGTNTDIRNTFLLLDIGSSTVDLTALKQNGKEYNHGNTYLGARIIDYQILNFFQEEIKNKNVYDYYDDYVRNNNGEKQILLKCRYAKEDIFTKSMKKKSGYTPEISYTIKMPGSDGGKVWVNLTDDDLKNIEKQPIKYVLQAKLGQSDAVLNLVNNNTWEEELIRYLSEQNTILKSEDFIVNELILTGSASVMPSVNRACEKIFGIKPVKDSRRACSIASGLVLTGISNERSREFKENIEVFSRHLPSIIEEDVINLAEKVSLFFSDYIVDDVIKTQLLNWKKGEITTLEDAIEVIKHKCSEDSLKNLLKYNDQYNSIIKTWIEIIVDKIAKQLSSMGKKYGVEFRTDTIKDIIFPDVNMSGLSKGNASVDLFGDGYDIVNSILSIITNAASTIGVFFVGVIIAAISDAIGAGIFFVLISNPVGTTVLVAIALYLGIKAGGNVQKSLENNKEKIISKIYSWDFPKPVRFIIPETVLIGKLPEQKNQTKEKVYNSFTSSKTKADLSNAIIAKLQSNINRCVNEIRYVIENNAVRAEWEQEAEEAPVSLRDQIAKRLERL